MTKRATPKVEILWFAGCPNAAETRKLVERVAHELGTEPEITMVAVADAESAGALRFLGSPTVRIDGVDVEPGAEARTDYVLACRIYRTAEGLSGQPSDAWIRQALAAAATNDSGAWR